MKQVCRQMVLLLVLTVAVFALTGCGKSDAARYEDAVKLFESGDTAGAAAAFAELGDYEQAADYAAYIAAKTGYDAGDWEAASAAFGGLAGFLDSDTLKAEADGQIAKGHYDAGAALLAEGAYGKAAEAFAAAGDYEDAAQQKAYAEAVQLGEDGSWDAAEEALAALGDYGDAVSQMAYYEARRAEAEDRVFEAVDAYAALDGFRDSADRQAAVQQVIDDRREAKFQPGCTVRFGHFEQDGSKDNGAELIEWTVIGRDGKKALLLSLNALEAKAWHSGFVKTSWAECELRVWLCGEFADTAFTVKERTALAENAEGDLVFCLNEEELAALSEADRIGTPTDLAVAHGAVERDNGGTAWWLRNSGRIAQQALVVNGSAVDSHNVNVAHDTVRPAIWVAIDSGLFD